MDQQFIISQLEGRASSLRLPMSEVCRRAKLHPTTFSRWKLSDKNPDPIGATIKSLAAIDEVLKAAEATAQEEATSSHVMDGSSEAQSLSAGLDEEMSGREKAA